MQLNGGDADSPADAFAGCVFPDSLLNDPILRTESIGGLASQVSIHPAVRAALNQRQVNFAGQPGGALLDGRDIGTVIAPHADAKLYVTARSEVRAARRHSEMRAHGIDAAFEDILADIKARDTRDTGRADSPLKPALDADLLDTSELTICSAVQAAIALVEAKLHLC